MQTQVNGATLHYTDQGHGPAVLLVHAFPMRGAMWQPQLAALADHYRVIVPDLRGFGQSDAPAGPYTMETLADDLAGLLDRLGIARAVLVGLSMGGYIAFAFARRHSARLHGLVFADTRAGTDTPEGKAARETNAQLVESSGMLPLADKMLPSWFAAATAPELRDAVRSLFLDNRAQGVAAALRGMALRADASELLPQIKVPTLFIVGTEDALTPPSEARAMHNALPGSRLVEISAAGHLSNMEQPAAFNAALLEFLGEMSFEG